MENKKLYIDKIDIVRGIAILWVFLYHLQLSIFEDYKISSYKYNFINIFNKNYLLTLLNVSPAHFGGIGVWLFFIISGFVIHFGFVKNEDTTPNLNLKEYFLKRVFRIYPPYLVAFILFCFLNVYLHKLSFGNILSHLFMLHNCKKEYIMSINPSFWSLAFEFQFYILYPVFLKVRSKIGTLNILYLLMTAQALWMVLSHWKPKLLDQDFVMLLSVFPKYFIWVMGAYLAEQFHKGKRIFNLGKYQILMICLVTYVYALSKMHIYLTGVPFVMCCFVVLDWYLISPSQHKIQENNSLFNNWLVKLGLYSYSFYLFHQPLLDLSIRYLKAYNPSIAFLTACGIVIFFLLYIYSKYSYKYLELNSLKLKNIFKTTKLK